MINCQKLLYNPECKPWAYRHFKKKFGEGLTFGGAIFGWRFESACAYRDLLNLSSY